MRSASTTGGIPSLKVVTENLIELRHVSKSYGGHAALMPSTVEFRRAATTVLIGPSGCGKSTLLRMIIGLISPDTGRILIDGRELRPQEIGKVRHGIGYVIQEGGLFPHLSTEANITLVARYLNRDAGWIRGRVHELAALVRMPVSLLRRYPADLSGGQRQRACIMRALMLDPAVFLLDEPLGALDPITRYELQGELKGIFDALGKTVVLVTHDMNEAAYFGGTIIMMREGRIIQSGTLDDLLKQPAEDFVRDFIRAQRTILPQVLP